MSDFLLYKKRDFSALMSDTMQFFKQFWKNYFRNYVLVNGALLLLMCVLYFLAFKDFFKNMYNPAALSGSWLTNMSHPALMVIGMLLFFIVGLVFLIFTLGFPMVYLNLLKTETEESVTSSEIFTGIKSIAGRIFAFGFISSFIMMPLGIVVFAIGAVLSFLLIGIPLLILAFPTLMIWLQQALYVYIEEDVSYFPALGKGFKITFEKYWHVVGSTIVIFFFLMIVTSIFTMVPSFMMLGSVVTSGGSPDAMKMTPFILAFYIVGMIFSFFANNIMFIQQGLIYYSSQENSSNYQALSEIETIGSNEA